MADSVRLQILKEVERIARTVEGQEVVTRNSNDALSMPNYPAILIVAGDETLEPMLNDVDQVDWQIGLELWVKSESNLGDAQEVFLASVQTTFGQNRELLDKVHFIQDEGARQWIPINEALTITAVMLTYRAMFRRFRQDPLAWG